MYYAAIATVTFDDVICDVGADPKSTGEDYLEEVGDFVYSQAVDRTEANDFIVKSIHLDIYKNIEMKTKLCEYSMDKGTYNKNEEFIREFDKDPDSIVDGDMIRFSYKDFHVSFKPTDDIDRYKAINARMIEGFQFDINGAFILYRFEKRIVKYFPCQGTDWLITKDKPDDNK